MCPNNICHGIREAIRHEHRYNGPSWKNIDASKWCTNAIEIAKCYMAPDGYSAVSTFADTDFNDVLAAREVGRVVRHSADLSITDKDLAKYIDTLIDLLSDPKYLATYQNAQVIVNKLIQLKSNTLTITTSDIILAMDNTLKDIVTKQTELIDAKKNEAEGGIEEKTNASLKLLCDFKNSIANTQTLTLNQIAATKVSAVSEIENVSKIENIAVSAMGIYERQLVNEEIKTVSEKEKQHLVSAGTKERQLVSEDIKSVAEKEEQELAAAGAEKRDLVSTEIKNVSEKEKLTAIGVKERQLMREQFRKANGTEYKQIFTLQDVTWSLPLLKEPVSHPEQRHTSEGKMSQWADCIARKDEKAAYELIEQGILPTNEELIHVCNEFGRKSKTFSKVCNKISENIRKESDKVIDAWASYRVSDLDKDRRITNIVFVVSYKDSADDSINVEVSNYKIKLRCATHFSKESEDILAHELLHVTSNLQNEQKVIQNEQTSLEQLRKIIFKHADKLMDDHSNVSVISPSFKRSIGYSTEHHHILEEPCIAMFVPVKGFIPIQEDPLPKEIDGYYVDVVEGQFDLFTGRSNDFHDKLKMGLAIHAKIRDNNGYILGGTLGGFLEHPDHGLCGVTCAHVVSLQDELVRRGSFRPENRQVFQPIGNKSMPFGNVVRIHHHVGDELSPGMEVAVLKIDERHPENGSFPLAFNYEEAGFDNNNPLTYNSGEVREASEIKRRTEVFKFGMESGITRGSFRLQGPVVRKGEMEQGNGFGIRLKNQIEILQIGTKPFAEEGDSGALVFVEDRDNGSVAIGIVEGGLRGRVFVTPICDILRAVSSTQLKMKQFDIRYVGNYLRPSDSASSDSGINSDQQMEVDSSGQGDISAQH